MNGQSRCWFLNCLYLEYIAYIKDLIERKKKTKNIYYKKKVNKTTKFLESTVNYEVWYFVHGFLYMHITCFESCSR